MTLRLRLLLALGVALALVATGCSSDDADPQAGADVAASVLSSVEATLGTATTTPEPDAVPDGCHIERTEDEYGFPVDIVVCDGEPDPDAEPDEDLTFVEWAGTEDADALSALVRDALVVRGGCADDELIRALDLAAAASPADVRAPLEVLAAEIAQAAAFCGTDATQWEAHLRSAIASLEAFVREADDLRLADREASNG